MIKYKDSSGAITLSKNWSRPQREQSACEDCSHYDYDDYDETMVKIDDNVDDQDEKIVKIHDNVDDQDQKW